MSFDIQWQLNGNDLTGQMGNTIAVLDAYRGKNLGFRLIATGPGGSTAVQSPTVPIPAAGPALTISGNLPSSGIVGQAYLSTCGASGGTGPYAFSLAAGTLPSGTSLNTSTGVISGTLTTAQVKTGIVVRVTDHLGATASLPPATVTVAASGTGVTPATIFAAVQAASPGAILSMQPGNYTIAWSSISKAAPGIILQGQPGVICPTGVQFTSCAGIALKSVAITGLLTPDGYACQLYGCDRLTIDSCSFPGNNPGAVHTGVAIFTRNGSNITLTNNTIANHGDLIDGLDNTNVVVASNHLTKSSNNFIFFAGVQGALIEKNYIANLDHLNPGSHPDTIQLAGGAARSSNVVIRYNNFDAQTGDTTVQGPFAESTDGLTITSNCIFGAGDNGALVSDCTNVTITNNFEQAWVTGPRIYCRNGSNNVTMTGNFSQALPFSLQQPPEPDSTNVTIGVNTLIPQATSGSDTTRRNAFLQSNPLIPVS